jgi:hypothetical protein
MVSIDVLVEATRCDFSMKLRKGNKVFNNVVACATEGSLGRHRDLRQRKTLQCFI